MAWVNSNMNDCIFCKIVNKEIPKEFRYEDEFVVVFDDINPVNKVHVLVIPKEHIESFEKIENDEFLPSIRKGIQKISKDEGLVGKGYKILVNGGGAQVINHLHFHLIGPIGLNAKL